MGIYTRNIIVPGVFTVPVRTSAEAQVLEHEWALEIYSGSVPSWKNELLSAYFRSYPTAMYQPTGALLAQCRTISLVQVLNKLVLETPCVFSILQTGIAGYYILYKNNEKLFVGTIGSHGCDFNIPNPQLVAQGVIHIAAMEITLENRL